MNWIRLIWAKIKLEIRYRKKLKELRKRDKKEGKSTTQGKIKDSLLYSLSCSSHIWILNL